MAVPNSLLRSIGLFALTAPLFANGNGPTGPTADAGNAQSAESATWVGLDGRGSSGSGLSYSWSQLAGPTIALIGDDTPVPYFLAPIAQPGNDEIVQLQLQVTDDGGLTDVDTVDVVVTAAPDEFLGTLDPAEALDPYRTGPGELTYREAKHFLRRLTFGTDEAQVQSLIAMGTDAWMSEQLVKVIDDSAAIADAGLTPVTDGDCPDEWHKGTQAKITNYALYLLLNDDDALLRERMFYFFHDLWATSTEKLIGHPSVSNHFRYNHARLLQDAALTTDYRQTLYDLTYNESMLVWLNGHTPYGFTPNNTPNENYGREFWELFTLGVLNPITGEPSYCEDEILEVALALTGITLGQIQGSNCPRNQAYDNPATHSTFGPFDLFDGLFRGDAGDPPCTLADATVFTGVDDAWGVIDATLGQRGAKDFLAYHVARFVWAIEPPEAVALALADQLEAAWNQNDYTIHTLLRTVATSKAMFAPSVRKAKVSTPVDFAVRGIRTIGLDMGKNALRTRLEGLEHDLLNPPSVEGWPEDETWIGAGAQVLRMELANQLAQANSDPGDTPDVSRFYHADPELNDAATFLAGVLRIFDLDTEHFPLPRFRAWVGYLNDLPATPGEHFDARNAAHHKSKVLGALWLALCTSEGAAL